MEPTPDKTPSYPNADQKIPGIVDSEKIKAEAEEAAAVHPEESGIGRRRAVGIFEALDTQKREGHDAQRLKTFQEDIAEAMKHDNLSMIQVAMAEKKRQERDGTPSLEQAAPSSKKPLIIGAVVAAVLMLFVGGFFYVNFLLAPSNTANQQIVLPPLLYTEEKVSINIDEKDGDDIARLIRRELDVPLEIGAMKALAITSGSGTSTHEIGISEFVRSISNRVSDTLLRSFKPQFLLGIYSFSPKDFFLIVQVESYDSAFAGMLEWEPDMENDIGNFMITRKPILPITALTQPKSATSSFATSTIKSTSPFGTRVWVDRVVNNRDTRLLIDSDGSPSMLYTFIDKNTLVISSSDKALKEIVFRLTAGRIAR